MTSKERLNQLKVRNNYLPRMKGRQRKCTEEELIKKILQNDIPESLVEKFELLGKPKVNSIRAVLLTLENIERCENLDNQTKSKKPDKGRKKQDSKKKDKNSEFSNTCRKPGHNHK